MGNWNNTNHSQKNIHARNVYHLLLLLHLLFQSLQMTRIRYKHVDRLTCLDIYNTSAKSAHSGLLTSLKENNIPNIVHV